MSNFNLRVEEFPEVAQDLDAVYRSRLLRLVSEFLDNARLKDARITISTASMPATRTSSLQGKESDEATPEARAQQYSSQPPLFSFEQLIVPETTREDLLSAVDIIRVESQVFDVWGLREIEPFPRTALNFHGLPGTGKTLAAHSIANLLKKHILVASYAEIESKFHGDGPKNVKAIFQAAERDNAILFIDEADSLLSKRLTNVTQGSEQAINSMRSQLLICLERFRGVVIFATNLVENYNKAFETRIRHIRFLLPDEQGRWAIWHRHLPERLPLAPGVSIDRLAAEIDDICGRDIKNAVIDAAVRVARRSGTALDMQSLQDAIERIKAARIKAQPDDNGRPLTPEEKEETGKQIREALQKQGQANSSGSTLNGSTSAS